MRTGKRASSTAVAVVAILLWLAVSAGARPPANGLIYQDTSSVTGTTSPLLQYQGRLTNPSTGEPVADGTYTMTFRLYTVVSGGTAQWTETKDVAVQGGLFSTVLGDTTALSQSLFNGQELWLGIKVGADAEAIPRQQLLPGAYALSLVPGAVVEANSASPILRVNNTGSGNALQVSGPVNVTGNLTISGSLSGGTHAHSGADITSGTVAEARIHASIARDSEIMPTVLGNDGAGSTLDADLLDGSHASAFAASSHSHDHGTLSGLGDDDHTQYFHLSQNETVNGIPAFNGGTSSSTAPFTVDSTYLVTNLNADLLDGSHASAFASASHNHWGASWTGSGTGLSLSGGTTGLYASGSSYGLYGTSNGYGVWGYSSSSSGVGTLGYTAATTGNTYAVWGYNNSDSGRGVYGQATSTTGTTYGVYGKSDSTSISYGVYGHATAGSGNTFGTYGRSDSTGGAGVWGYASAGSGSGIGVGGGSNAGYGLYTPGNLYVGGTCTGCTMVFVAQNAGQELLRVGDVVAVSGVGAVLQGHTTPILRVRQAASGDVAVLGVVLSRGEFYAASDEQQEIGDIVQPGKGDVAPDDYVLVVTSGLAQVRVAPGLTDLTPGQRLTVAEVAGRATLAGADAPPDLVFGQAMEAKPDENGLLWALITVQ